MSEPGQPVPQPTAEDEHTALELQHVVEDNDLRGAPQGEERCDDCVFYLNPGEALSYCWHPKLRILVGADWWCRWWEEPPG